MQPIKLKPAFKDYIWGGTRLRDDYKMEAGPCGPAAIALSRLADCIFIIIKLIF